MLPKCLRSGGRSRWAALALIAAALIAASSSTGQASARQPEPDERLVAADVSTPEFTYPIAGMTGWDISWPQCANHERPEGPINFAVIGVNGGKMFTKNDCLAEMFRYAGQGRTAPQVYLNVNGLPKDWTSASTVCAKTDIPCQAYMYGYEGAAFSHQFARSQGVDPMYWWLDVETGNAWSDQRFLNERAIGGAIDYLQSTHHVVGIYSTPSQWSRIAGGFAPGLMNWTAGAADLLEATTRCDPKYAFGGGRVVLVQYVSEHFDTSYSCPGTGVGRRALLPYLAAEG